MSKKKLIILIVITISFSILSLIGTTYALFTKTIKGEKNIKITSGNLKIDFKEGSTIQLEEARPTEDEEGLKMEPYTFTIENSGDVKSYYNISIKEDESNTLNNNYVRYSLVNNKGYDSGVRVMGGEGSSEFIIKSEDKIEVGDNIQYSLRIWLDKDVDNSVQGQSYKAKVVVNGYSNKTKNATEVLLTQFTNNEEIQDYDINYTKGDSSAKENKMYVFHHEKTEQTPELIDYRYIGANPNNYVTFNGEVAGWRIIGIETVDNGSEIKEKRIKLIKKDPLSVGTDNYISFDNKPNGTGSSESEYGSNDWYDSRLMMILNPNYEEEKTGASGSIYWNRENGSCPLGENNGTTNCNFTSTGLKVEVQQMIGDAKWYLGGTENHNSADNGTANHFYSYERSKTVYSSSRHPRKTNWTGKVGIMYPSDYGYATSGGTSKTRAACLSDTVYNYRAEDCRNNDWLFINEKNQWTISPRTISSRVVFAVLITGSLNYNWSYASNHVVRPVVYLTSDVKYQQGDGSEENPFIFTK